MKTIKDLNIEELLNHLGDIAEQGDAEHWDRATNELLQRFRQLENKLEVCLTGKNINYAD